MVRTQVHFRSKTSYILVAALLAIAGMTTVVAPKKAVAAGPLVVNIGSAVYPSVTQIAEGAGYLTAELKKVNAVPSWHTFNSGHDLATALASNSINIVTSVTGVPMAPLIVQNFPFRIFWVTDSSINDDEIVATNAIQNMAGLAGQKVTYTSATGQQYSFLTAAKIAGLSASSFTNVDLPAAQGAAAILRGDVVAADLYQPYADQVAHTAGFHVLMTDAQLTAATKGSYRVADFVASSQGYMKAHPAIISAIVNALSEAANLYKNDPAKAAALSWKQDGAPSPAAALSLLQTSTYPTLQQQTSSAFLGTPGHPGAMASVIKNIADFDQSIGSIPSTVTLAQANALIDSRPLMKLLAPTATKVAGIAVPGKRTLVRILGSGFYGRPSVKSSAPGTTALVVGDIGGKVLNVIVTVPAGSSSGIHRFTIRFAKGQTTSVSYNQGA
jgi:taurine transport system substrate-binding protein